MKKIIFVIMLSMLVLFSSQARATDQWESRDWFFTEGSSIINIVQSDGSIKQVDAYANTYIEPLPTPNQGRIMVPIRIIGEAVLGAFVQWKDEQKEIYMIYGVPLQGGGEQYKEIRMFPYSKTSSHLRDREAAKIVEVTSWKENTPDLEENGKKYLENMIIDIPPEIKENTGITFIPLRFVCEIFFSNVHWDASVPMGQRVVSVNSRVGFIPAWIPH
jgi:hypothetical protein